MGAYFPLFFQKYFGGFCMDGAYTRSFMVYVLYMCVYIYIVLSSYNKQKVAEIENLSVDDPNEFWKKIKELGPRKQNDIPMTIRNENGVTSDRDAVLDKWQTDFSNLLNQSSNTNDYDGEFYNQCMNNKTTLEENMIPEVIEVFSFFVAM